MITFQCPQCAAQIRVPDSVAGRRGKCFKCAAVVDVPASTPPALPPPRENVDDWGNVDLREPAAPPIPTTVAAGIDQAIGIDVATPAMLATPKPAVDRRQPTEPIVVERRFVFLRVVATLYDIAAMLATAIGVTALLSLFFAEVRAMGTGVLIVAASSFAVGLTAGATAEVIRVFISVEENSRKSALLLAKVLEKL